MIGRPSCCLLVMLACGLPFVAVRAAPLAVCDEPEFHFPPTPDTGEIVHTFQVRNDGMDDLVIRRVHVDCGCLLVSLPRDVLPPGDSMELRARFILRGRRGPQRRRVTLDTNDPRRPALTLSLIGRILAEAAVDPARLFFGNIRPDAVASLEALVEFQCPDGRPYAVTEVIAPPGFEVEVLPDVPGRRWRMVVRTQPPLPLGRFHGAAAIRTDHPRSAELSLELSGRVVSAVFPIPDEIVLDGAVRRPVNTLLLLRSADARPFQVREIRAPLPDLRVAHRPATGGGVRVELREWRADPELDGRALRIITDHPEQPELLVPIVVK